MDAREREQVEREIRDAREGVGEKIDELDRQLRHRLDFASMAKEHAPQLVVGGIAVGFLVGFGFPKVFKRVLQFGVPVALIAYKVKQARDKANAYEV